MGPLRASLPSMESASDVKTAWWRRPGWNWMASLLVALVGFCVLIVGQALPSWSPARLALALTAFGSLGPLLLLPLAVAVPGRAGWVLRSLVLITTVLALAWFTAAVELSLDQGRSLHLHELWLRFDDPLTRDFVISSAVSWRMAGLVAALVGAVVGGALLLARAPLTVPVAIALTLTLGGALANRFCLEGSWWSDEGWHLRNQQAVCAPWSRVVPAPVEELAGYRFELQPDIAAMRRLRLDLGRAEWAAGPDAQLAPLAGRYRGRNVVVVLLESHRLSDVEPFGRGAEDHRPLSPFLTALADHGLAFTNYVQSGPGTIFAQFCLATGCPAHPRLVSMGLSQAPGLGRLGRFPDFTAAGYRCEWLQATDSSFAVFAGLLSDTAVEHRLLPDELAGLERTWWSPWGMPDEQLFALAWRRYQAHLATRRPALMCLLTISNHSPFLLPPLDGQALPADHVGGMRYADRALEGFVRQLRALPPEDQPLLLITGDHGHRQRLGHAKPLGPDNPESFRIPGLLVAPDRALAGQRHDAPFMHEDLLDLALLLVSGDDLPPPRKFIAAHRVAALPITGGDYAVLTSDAFLAADGDDYTFTTPWRLTPSAPETTRALLEAVRGGANACEAAWRRWPVPVGGLPTAAPSTR